jgi:uncharacterized cupin superfamily protein
MPDRARLEKTERGLIPTSPGWYVLHASEAPWLRSERFGRVCNFEGDAGFEQIGINIRVLEPGQPASLYHRENAQENFLVLSGECTLVVEDEEVLLRAGHFVHCPPETNHVFVGAGNAPSVILMVGHRPAKWSLFYPQSKVAGKHGAATEKETASPREAYQNAPVFNETIDPEWPLFRCS